MTRLRCGRSRQRKVGIYTRQRTPHEAYDKVRGGQVLAHSHVYIRQSTQDCQRTEARQRKRYFAPRVGVFVRAPTSRNAGSGATKAGSVRRGSMLSFSALTGARVHPYERVAPGGT